MIIQIIRAENILSSCPPPPNMRTPTNAPHPTYIHTPLLSSTRHTHTLLDPYTPLRPNQTGTLVSSKATLCQKQNNNRFFPSSGPALMKAERRLTQDLLGTVLCQSELDLRWQMEEWDHALSTLDMHMQDVVSWAASCRLVCYCTLKSTLLLHFEIQFVTACWNPVC